MERPVSIVVLSKFRELFEGFFESVEEFAPDYAKYLVRDGNEIATPLLKNWITTQGPEKFSMAGNGNLGLKAIPDTHDILYCGDDIRFLTPKTVEILQKTAYLDPEIGILSPRIIGRGSYSQVACSGVLTYILPLEMWFPCVYIKREVINMVGYLDEQFDNFGSDDLDYCIRAVQSGFKLAVTNEVVIQHGASPEGGPSTFCKTIGAAEWHKQQDVAIEKLRVKLGVDFPTLEKYLATGDLKLLANSVPDTSDAQVVEPSMADAMNQLRSRSLYLATPAYGGWMSVNYVNSLLALTNLCHDIGIKYTISFKYNESLIPRARNAMVDEYLRTSDFTDFFFIDADIGFEAKDIVTMMLSPEEVVGAPCVRKSFNWNRISTMIKKNGRSYSEDELAKFGGEFVVNFPPDKAPDTVNLGQMLEVQDVGTGIMRIRREVFDKFKQFHPDRWYLPMGGEGEKLPTYMFFQSRIDVDSGKFNPGGVPDYIPEDYAFCRDCQQAGIKIWMAPWLQTSHFGSYVFQGDLVCVAQNGGGLR